MAELLDEQIMAILDENHRRDAHGDTSSFPMAPPKARPKEVDSMTPASHCAVRTARADDLQAVLDIHAAHDADGGISISRSDRQPEAWRRMMATHGLTVYVAQIGVELVGTATALVMPNVTYDCAPTVFLEAVVVAPRYRRQGIARAILQRVLADANAAGCNKVQLLSHKRHATDGGHRLYTSLGFEPEAEGFRLYLRQGAPGSHFAARRDDKVDAT
jgi:GNAT superfamily N-acetyltransferase